MGPTTHHCALLLCFLLSASGSPQAASLSIVQPHSLRVLGAYGNPIIVEPDAASGLRLRWSLKCTSSPVLCRGAQQTNYQAVVRHEKGMVVFDSGPVNASSPFCTLRPELAANERYVVTVSNHNGDTASAEFQTALFPGRPLLHITICSNDEQYATFLIAHVHWLSPEFMVCDVM